ncbi:hypothetical protein [Streptomyces sp. NPDC054866]
MHRTTSVSPSAVSPFDQVDAALLDLASAPRPLTLPAALLSTSEPGAAWPVDLVRARMAHPSTPGTARAQVWAEIVRRRLTFGEPWGTVAVAMTVPVLRRAMARLPRLRELERGELEQEVLTAVIEQLAVLTPDEMPEEIGLQLVRAGDRAAHRLLYATQRDRRLGPLPLDEGTVGQPLATGSQAQAYVVLERAARAEVITSAEAELIAATRLDGQSAKECANGAGISVRAMFRRRSAAEQRLAQALIADEL